MEKNIVFYVFFKQLHWNEPSDWTNSLKWSEATWDILVRFII